MNLPAQLGQAKLLNICRAIGARSGAIAVHRPRLHLRRIQVDLDGGNSRSHGILSAEIYKKGIKIRAVRGLLVVQ
jgi:hypothetical protein